MYDTRGRVGIIVRTKNRPWFLRRALADILAEDYTDWIVHIVNDGGDSDAVDAAVAEQPPGARRKIAVTHNPTSRGRSAAANQGVDAAGCELVVLHDDDDLWHPQFLSRTVQWLDDHPGDIGVVTRTEIVYEKADAHGGYSESGRTLFWAALSEISFSDLLEINRWVPIAFLYRSVLHDRIGVYREEVQAAEDWDFNLRAAVGHQIGFISKPALAFWMQRVGVDGDAGNSMFSLAEEHERFDKRIRDDALRRYAAEYGSGLPLYLTRFVRETMRETVQDVVRQVVREEMDAALDRRPSDLQRVARRTRAWLRGRSR